MSIAGKKKSARQKLAEYRQQRPDSSHDGRGTHDALSSTMEQDRVPVDALAAPVRRHVRTGDRDFVLAPATRHQRVPSSVTGSDGSREPATAASDKKKYVYIRDMTWFDIALRFSVYAILQYLFYLAEFGIPFFMVSLIVAMYLSTTVRWQRRRPGELSAYSVFNPNFERLPGEMDGEKMARQMASGVPVPA